MRVTEALIHQNKRNKEKNKIEEEEPTYCYKERAEGIHMMNRTSSEFSSCYEEGINVGESIFDRKAVFKTK